MLREGVGEGEGKGKGVGEGGGGGGRGRGRERERETAGFHLGGAGVGHWPPLATVSPHPRKFVAMS